MNYSAIIEIPKGSDRRIHMSYDMSGFVDLGAIKEQIPVNNGIMPVAYGYLPSFINKAEGDPVDILVFSCEEYVTGDTTNVEILGMFTREDGDHKILAKDSSINYESFMDVPGLERKLLLEYFGYKSEITAVDDANKAKDYLNNSEMVSIA
ncbi:MAG: inorganic diphosphatase [Candidatus Moranbacteria bacterium]|nr:inorganic diphosphatase [Candidatus Moranbacteria bacterium]MDD3964916.1 inorganic diphosphatase [Candidatus Moranbacteria bacterium]